MRLNEWFDSTLPVPRIHFPDCLVSISGLADELSILGPGAVIFEGCRSSGKTFVAKEVARMNAWAYHKTWETYGGAKKFISGKEGDVRGASNLGEYGMDISQGALFALDTIPQITTDPVVLDRGYFSTMWFQDEVHPKRFDLYCKALTKLRAVVVIIRPESEGVLLDRIKDRDIELWELIYEEKAFIRMAARLTVDLLVMVRSLKQEAVTTGTTA